MEDLMPSADMMAFAVELATTGFVFGFGISLAYGVLGHTVLSLLRYLRGGY